LKRLVNTMRALSDAIRLRIINLLHDRELCVCEIVDTLALPQSTISRHLTVLKNAGIVEDRRYGQWAFYKLIVGREDNSFIKTLIENEFKEHLLLQEDIEILKKRLEKGRDCCKLDSSEEL